MKPRLFIGSSVESLSIAYALQEGLEYDAEVTVWNQGIFELSGSTLGSLVNAAQNFEAAVFVFAPDDIAKIRRTEMSVPRDNVIFEIGLFMGILGTDRVYFIVPRDTPDLHIPTDLLGITPATFDPKRSDNNLLAALGPACSKIRSQLRTLPPHSESSAPTTQTTSNTLSDDEALAIIGAWVQRTVIDVLTRLHLHTEIDQHLSLPPGTSVRLTHRAVQASSRKLKVAVNNDNIIQIIERA